MFLAAIAQVGGKDRHGTSAIDAVGRKLRLSRGGELGIGGVHHRGIQRAELAHQGAHEILPPRRQQHAEGGEVTRHVEIGAARSITSFGEDRDGELYFCSFDGRIHLFVERED